MKIATAFAILATSATAHPVEERAEENKAEIYAHNVLHKLEMLSWDKSQPPKYETGKDWQYTCAPILMGNLFGSSADQVQFWEKNSILTDRPVKTEAFYLSVVDATSVHTGSEGTGSVETAQSTTNTKTETKGWNIGAKVTGNFGKKDVAAGVVELSGQYSESTTLTNTETTTVTFKGPCPPAHECRIETWTFHLNIDATVSRELGYQVWSISNGMLGERPLCLMEEKFRICDQFTSRYDANCAKDGSFGLLEPTKNVHLTVPIREANGIQAMSRLVLVQEPLSLKKARDESVPANMGTKETIQKAIEQGTKFEFLN
ncbi:uncharacterized protein BBA_06207 [Beauveria bassiana ARSEF 2860]|uniref:Uncharacterized protein n=1 Tax=Beauveria bassiana (strain ARSEF 2860) TaxID=655819 RepID=J4UKY2_BEAB2|nr:uncharacterized protein BBA_06207 [Beauveria bassiana ARSEF 2860]EJP65032.1 hypothetical protein BBA_06207 [Beauveria bassiana ARSEF 2860]